MKKNLTYSDKLKDPRWQKKRLQVFQRDKFKCTKCGDAETTLHVHHNAYNGEPWDADLKQLDTLCADCHEITERLKREGCSSISTFKYSMNNSHIKIMIAAFNMSDTGEPVATILLNENGEWKEISHKISYRTACKMVKMMKSLIK
jgi:hypothetical protein